MGKRRLTSSYVKSTVGTTSGHQVLRTSRVRLSQINANRLAFEQEQVLRMKELTSDVRAEYNSAEGDEPPFEPDFEWGDDTFPDDAEEMGRWNDEQEQEDVRTQCTEHSNDGPALDETRREVFASYHHIIGTRPRDDQRTRSQRHANANASWNAQMPELVTAYLQWRYAPSPDIATESGVPVEHTFEVTAVDIKGNKPFASICARTDISSDRVQYRRVNQCTNERANVALVRAGLLGSSPINPSVAISLQCLELYHQIRRRQSSFSIQAMAKVLCALHNVTYFPTFRTQLSIAFDIYLDIQTRVQTLVNQALQRDTPDWRLLNSCPPCGYKLEAEPKLCPERLQSMDGNSSLRRVDGAHTDDRIYPSDYFISPADVDRFKDDVRTRPGTTYNPSSSVTAPSDSTPPYGGGNTVCTDNWAAANASSKETLQLFEQTGVFVSVCRHGMMQTLVEMRRSGELAKYGLATLNKIMDTFGDDQGMGYDIACSHMVTVAASSIGEKARVRRLLLAINAFHGHAHNLMCQLRNHPMYLPGLGIEDLETCERVFSSSNAVARVVRYSSYFHWRQFIELHYRQWDEDKYFECSRFLYNNYQQALSIIAEFTPEIERYKALHGLQDSDFPRWRSEQLQYLTDLKDEPEADVLKVEYVDALQKLQRAEATYGNVTTVPFQGYTPADFTPTGSIPADMQTRHNAVEAERRAAHRKLLLAMNVADDLERRLGLSERWADTSPEFSEAAAYLKHRRFLRIVEELERLVVQRLFELAKANLMETGYRMRKHIGQAIARRSSALHTALDKYNEQAPLHDPPRPILDYSAVAAYSWLGEFELLKESRHDILQKPWAIPANQEVMSKFYRVQRAHEEIGRLNVEIRRLQTWVDDEDRHLHSTVAELGPSNLVSHATLSHSRQRERVNNVHRARLRVIFRLPGYSGSTTPGIRMGNMDTSSSVPAPAATPVRDEVEIGVDLRGEQRVEVEEDDALRDEALRYDDTMASMMRVHKGWII